MQLNTLTRAILGEEPLKDCTGGAGKPHPKAI
nr:MAG TPA: hypothetical protein [Caudoviricetes sp.]